MDYRYNSSSKHSIPAFHHFTQIKLNSAKESFVLQSHKLKALSFGVTGYSLPWDQVGYWACKIVTSVPEALDNLIRGIGKISVVLKSI